MRYGHSLRLPYKQDDYIDIDINITPCKESSFDDTYTLNYRLDREVLKNLVKGMDMKDIRECSKLIKVLGDHIVEQIEQAEEA